MTGLLIETYLVFGAATAATALNLFRAYRGGARRHFYAGVGLVAGYNAVVYGLALVGVLHIRDIGPDYLRPANIAVMGALAANAIAYWRKGGEKEEE